MSSFMPFGGVDQRKSALMADPSTSSDLLNVELHPVGALRKRSGYVEFSAPMVSAGDAPEPIIAMKAVDRGRGADPWFYVVSETAVWRARSLYNSTWVKVHVFPIRLVDRLPVATVARYDEKDHCLYLADGANVPLIDDGEIAARWRDGIYGDGSDGSGQTGIPAGDATGYDEWRDWREDPPAGVYLRGEGRQDRIYAWGFAGDPNRIDYSELGVPWNMLRANVSGQGQVDGQPVFPDQPSIDGGYFYAVPGDGDYVVGVVDLFDRLVVLKRRSTLVYSGLAGVDLSLRARYPIGCTSYRSVVKVGNDLMWWADEGPVTLSGVQQYGDLYFDNLGLQIVDEIAAVTTHAADRIVGYHDAKAFRVCWLVPTRGSRTPNRLLVYYYDQPRRWTIFSGALAQMRSVEIGASVYGSGDDIYGGTSDGKIVVMHTGNTDGGAPISCHYVTQWLDLGDPDTRKRPQHVDVIAGKEDAKDVSVQLGLDFRPTWLSSVREVRTLGEDDALWGEAKWDEDLWADPQPGLRRWELDGLGFYMRLKFSSASIKPMELLGWKINATAKGER